MNNIHSVTVSVLQNIFFITDFNGIISFMHYIETVFFLPFNFLFGIMRKQSRIIRGNLRFRVPFIIILVVKYIIICFP